jgi:hypothetical protein
MCDDAYPFEKEDGIKPYMGSPKPSYYPIYLEQQGENGFLNDKAKFSTMMDKSAKLRGWKMYPARMKYQTDFYVDDAQQENTNPAIPLGAGSTFKCNIRFHNLKPIELGALLYVVMLQKQNCHTLGFGKAFGYGVCKYEITDTTGFSIDEIDKYITSFFEYMETRIPNYKKTPQLRELLLMTNPYQTERLKRPLEYMELKEFVKCKQHTPKNGKYGEYLPLYSDLLKPIEQRPSASVRCLADVTFFSGSLKKAKLKEGKDLLSKLLDMNGKKDKLKVGDVIEVEVIKNGKELRFVKKQ